MSPSPSVSRWCCPHCGADVARSALLCPSCRAPLTGPGAKSPVAVVEETPPAAPAPAPTVKAAAERPAVRVAVPAPRLPDDFFPQEAPPGRPVEEIGRGGAFKAWLAESLEELNGALTNRATTPEQKRSRMKAWVGVVTVLVGVPWLAYSWLIAPGKAPQGAVAAPAAMSSGASAGGVLSLATPAPSASAPEENAAAQGGAGVKEGVRSLLEAAAQLERMALYLPSDAKPGLPPLNPSSPEDLLPPLSGHPGERPDAPPDQRAAWDREVEKRTDLALMLGDRLVAARGSGVTQERAARTTEWMRHWAWMGAPDEAPAVAAPAGSAPSEAQVREILQALLVPADAEAAQKALKTFGDKSP